MVRQITTIFLQDHVHIRVSHLFSNPCRILSGRKQHRGVGVPGLVGVPVSNTGSFQCLLPPSNQTPPLPAFYTNPAKQLSSTLNRPAVFSLIPTIRPPALFEAPDKPAFIHPVVWRGDGFDRRPRSVWRYRGGCSARSWPARRGRAVPEWRADRRRRRAGGSQTSGAAGAA